MNVEAFQRDGFLRIDGAFPRELAAAGREILWKDTGCDPHDPATWMRPVVRLGMYGQAPFREAANTPALHAAFDALVGKGRWRPPRALGTFPVRFPGADPGDTGWHVDASFPGEDASDYMSWRINARSRGRALLMLFLFSDVGERDAPTRIAVGSHLEVARILQPRGEEGMSFTELAAALPRDWPRVALAIGTAGTVYLCHSLLVHAAQPHRGAEPRFMAQPPLLPADLD